MKEGWEKKSENVEKNGGSSVVPVLRVDGHRFCEEGDVRQQWGSGRVLGRGERADLMGERADVACPRRSGPTLYLELQTDREGPAKPSKPGFRGSTEHMNTTLIRRS